MAGEIIELFPKQLFNFDNGSGSLTVVRNLDVLHWTSGVVYLRLHSTTFTNPLSHIMVYIFPMVPTLEEPEQDFECLFPIATFEVNGDSSVDFTERAAMAADFGHLLKVKVEGTNASGSCSAELSAIMVVKDH